MYDTVAQYGQVLSNEVDDWHPPVMVRVWQALTLFGSGTAPMFVLQVGLYALGVGLIVGALVQNGRKVAAMAAAAWSLSPLLLGWQMVVLKDAQMLGALLAALGIVAHYRLAARRVPCATAVLVALLIGYATLVRANALFATIPLAFLLLPRPTALGAKALAAFVAIAVMLGVTPWINLHVFGAQPSGVAASQPLFDLAAIASDTPNSVAPFTPVERAQIMRRHCVKAFFWDPVSDPGECGPITQRANALPQSELYLDLARAAATHPIAYLDHRLKHWNSTERWLVPPGRIDAAPPDEAEANDLSLKTPPSTLVPLWQDLAGWEERTPLGWPIIWTTLSFLLLPLAFRRRSEPPGNLAFALLVSAASLEASFLFISIASDLRYHTWPMTASALGLILLSAGEGPTRRGWMIMLAVVSIVAAGGVITRSSLPVAPSSYQAMLHASAG
jgi:general stress protein CsbA